jgi:peptidoglycan/xylan/chitin deacetylase (PgdA/CDA1 family)
MRNGATPVTGCARLAILGFHKIGSPPPKTWDTWFYIPERIFAGQMAQLRDSGWSVIDVQTLLTGLTCPDTLPERSVLLTFDDGYRSMREVALPVLRSFGFPAVMFVPTAFIGHWNSFDAGVEPREPMCGWEDLEELQNNGVSIQAHGVSHCRFSDLAPLQLERELNDSKIAPESRLGNPVEVFSFPYGDAGESAEMTAQALRRTGYRAACVYAGGFNFVPVVKPYELARVQVGPDSDLLNAMENE